MSHLVHAAKGHAPLTLAMAVAVTTACRSDAVSVPPGLPPFGQCQVTLESYCGGPCPGYATVVDGFRHNCASARLHSRSSIGECPGLFYYTETSVDIGGRSAFYDTDGTMIGAREAADYNTYCNGASLSVDAGVVPRCPHSFDLELVCAR